MKKVTSIITIILLALAVVSCTKKEKVDTKDASPGVVAALENSYVLSQELTWLQLEAGADKSLDAVEIEAIGILFAKLAITNNININQYSTDKYFIALRKEYRDKYDVLADTVVFLKECEGYDQLGLAIQQISLEVRDKTTLPVEEVEVIEVPDTTPAEEPEGM
jgi:hypothetical protein